MPLRRHMGVAVVLVGLSILTGVGHAQESSPQELTTRADALTLQAESLARDGKLAEADASFQEALGLYEKAYGPTHESFYQALMKQSKLRDSLGMDREAVLERIVEFCRKVRGPDHRATLENSKGLAWYYRDHKKKYAESERLYREVLAIWERTHEGDVEAVVNGLANACEAQGKHEEVEKVRLRTLAIVEQVYGANDPRILPTLVKLVEFYTGRARPQEAAKHGRRTLSIADKLPAEDEPSLLPVLDALGKMPAEAGDGLDREAILKRALAIREATLKPDHVETGGALERLGAWYSADGKPGRAEPVLMRALTIYEKSYGSDDRRLCPLLYKLSEIHGRVGKDRAPWLERIIAIQRKALKPEDPERLKILESVAHYYLVTNRRAAAEAIHRELASGRERILLQRERELGEEHAQTIEARRDLAQALVAAAQFDRAETLSKRLLAALEKRVGPDHPDLVPVLHLIAEGHAAQRRFDQAEDCLRRSARISEAACAGDELRLIKALWAQFEMPWTKPMFEYRESVINRVVAMRKRLLGEDHPDTMDALKRLAGLYFDWSRYAESERAFRELLSIHEKLYGSDDRRSLAILSVLGFLCWEAGTWREAFALAQRYVELVEKKYGADHPNAILARTSLAASYLRQGRFAEAEKIYRAAIEVDELLPGFETRLAIHLLELGGICEAQGRRAEAEQHYLRALGIWDKLVDKDVTREAYSLLALGDLYFTEGRYAAAKPLYEKAYYLMAQRDPVWKPVLAMCIGSLGAVHFAQGQFGEAERLYREALRVHEEADGPDHPYVASRLRDVAAVCRETEQYIEAETLCRRALAIYEKVYGPAHPNVGVCLNHLAIVCERQGRAADAEPLYRRALTILENHYGKDHREVGVVLYNLGHLYAAQDRFAEARPFAARALEIEEKAVGPESPTLAVRLRLLTQIAIGTGELETAWQTASRTLELSRRSRALLGRSPLDRSMAVSHLEQGATVHILVSLALEMGKRDVDPFALLQQGEAVGLRELFQQAQARWEDRLPAEDKKRISDALALVNGLAQTVERADPKNPETARLGRRLKQAELDYERLVAEYAGRYEQAATTETLPEITSRQIVASPALEPSTAIVGWVDYGDWHWAYVVRPQGVEWVKLTGIKDPDKEAAARKRILEANHAPSPRAVEEIAPDLAEVYRLRVEPLKSRLEGVRNLIVVAQGWAAQMPLEMLVTGAPQTGSGASADGPWLGEQFTISYAPSATILDVLARRKAQRKETTWPRQLLALADPPFSDVQLAEMTGGGPGAPAAGDVPPKTALALRGLLRFDEGVQPPRLPGTRTEVRLISSLFEADHSTLLLGPQATERSLFELNATGELEKFRYVHLATHGYADTDRPELSGLVLALAPQDEQYDGRLQMREIFRLRLNADLVVLSACQTGLGKRVGSEGTVGLSTAFLTSGTPSLVMSLWNVPDLPTALLMHRFYENLRQNHPKADSLRLAKQWLRELSSEELDRLVARDDLLAKLSRGFGPVQQSDKGRPVQPRPFAHPHYWAGFVLSGSRV